MTLDITKEDRLKRYVLEHPMSKIANDYHALQKEKYNRMNVVLEIEEGMRLSKSKDISESAVYRKVALDKIASSKRRLEMLQRWSLVISLTFDENKRFIDIARELHITRERVRQIAADITKHLGVEFPSRRKGLAIITHCRVCNAEIKKFPSSFRGHGKHNCSEHRYYRKYVSKQEARKAHSDKIKRRYQTDPEYRAKRIAFCMKWHNKTKNNPERKAKLNEYAKTYYHRKRELAKKALRTKAF